ncbi:MAG: hypothetical protein DCC71_11915 [Proteobacteria bacterium]|nr:MAG: hypothetical protein DCC71_11915 [Pseudomonadota bacterium]
MRHGLLARTLGAAWLAVVSAVAPPASAVPYTFRNIADQTGPYTNFGGAPVINDDGDVAFEATLDDGTEGIFGGPDPGTDTIADDSGPFDTPIDLPSINAEGTVAFRAWLDPTPEHFLGLRGIFDGPDPDFDTVADESDVRFAAGLASPSIADDGTVAFDAIDGFGGFGIYTASDTGIETVADDDGALTGALFAAAINDAGTTVAFFGEFDGGGGIFTGDDLPDDRVADSSGPYAQFDAPAVNDDGTVIFAATLDGGGGAEGIYSGPDTTADRVVDTGGPYAGFAAYSINDEGSVVFSAELDAGGLGLFTGPSPTNDRVIRTGDPLFGSTVSFVSLSRENLNDNGEVAFLYELANGRSGVAVASPGALSRSIDAGEAYDGVRLTSAAGRGTVARLRAGVAAEDRTLALSFAPRGGGVGDELQLDGSGQDEIVVELAYAGAGAANESGLLLYWRDPGDGVWKNAVLGNTPPGGTAALGMSFDAYRSSLGAPPQLGAHGNDPDGDTVWAIVDHGGRFAVPEPGSATAGAAACLALAALGLLRSGGSTRTRGGRRWIGLGCLLALAAAPRDAGAQLTQSSSGFVFVRVFETPAEVQVTQGDGELAVSLAATAIDVIDLHDDFWLVDFEYQASALGSANVGWGGGAGSLELGASSRPELSPPAVGAPGDPLYNLDSAQAGATLLLTFTEHGAIASDTLPAGTPVSVDVHARVRSQVEVHGSLEPPNDTRAGASFDGRVIDESGGFAGVELFVGGDEIETRTLASAVGNVLEIRGILRVAGRAIAGAFSCCPGYVDTTTATIDGAGDLWMTLPAGVRIDADSGHDYSMPVPEPSPAALGLGIALALARMRGRRRCAPAASASAPTAASAAAPAPGSGTVMRNTPSVLPTKRSTAVSWPASFQTRRLPSEPPEVSLPRSIGGSANCDTLRIVRASPGATCTASPCASSSDVACVCTS